MHFRLNKIPHYIKTLKTMGENAIRNINNPGVMVLLYHRVGSFNDDLQKLSVSEKNFENQLIYLKENFEIISLRSVQKSLKSGNKQLQLVITFDDGYADNFENAYPILKKHKIPATFFITTGFIEKLHRPYWDLLTEIKLKDGEQAYHNACANLKIVNTATRDLVLKNKYKEILNANNESDIKNSFMSIKQVCALASDPLIEIGAHTIGHPMLSKLNIAEQRHEILSSKNTLESWTNLEIKSFAYPYGTRDDFGSETKNICEEIGFEYIVANYRGVLRERNEINEIPRCLIRDWPLKKFSRMINYYRYF